MLSTSLLTGQGPQHNPHVKHGRLQLVSWRCHRRELRLTVCVCVAIVVAVTVKYN